MSSLYEKIKEDQEYYVVLCEKFNEKVIYYVDAYNYKSPDCYGAHAKALLLKEANEQFANIKTQEK